MTWIFANVWKFFFITVLCIREGLTKSGTFHFLGGPARVIFHFHFFWFQMQNGLKSILDIEIFLHVDTGWQKRSEKSFHQFWHINKVKLLFFWYLLRGHIHPFTLITLTKPWWLLFWSKIRMQKILGNAKKCHFMLILANCLYQKAF